MAALFRCISHSSILLAFIASIAMVISPMAISICFFIIGISRFLDHRVHLHHVGVIAFHHFVGECGNDGEKAGHGGGDCIL